MTTQNNLDFAIIVPVKAINDYILEALPIILQLEGSFEVIIVPNDLPDNTDAPRAACLQHPSVRILPSGKISPALKRDMAARLSHAKYLAFIDDDAYPAKHWLRVAKHAFESPENISNHVACLGGPAVTPPDDDIWQQASGLFYETWVGGGGLSYRYKPHMQAFFVDDVPSVNMLVTREAFLAINGFANGFWPGEDTKFCLDLIQHGFRILYIPDLLVWHHRRRVFKQHLQQLGAYGKHRGYFFKRFPQTSRRLIYTIPSLFLLGNIVLCIASLCSAAWFAIWLALLGFYTVCVTCDVFLRTSRITLGLLTICTVVLSHLVYGKQFLYGLYITNLQSELR